MKTKDQIRIGDAVEVERFRNRMPAVSYTPTDPPSEPRAGWVPATVVHVSREEVGVAFSDGERLAIPRHARWWRPA